jgi:hypothetical protein
LRFIFVLRIAAHNRIAWRELVGVGATSESPNKSNRIPSQAHPTAISRVVSVKEAFSSPSTRGGDETLSLRLISILVASQASYRTVSITNLWTETSEKKKKTNRRVNNQLVMIMIDDKRNETIRK